MGAALCGPHNFTVLVTVDDGMLFLKLLHLRSAHAVSALAPVCPHRHSRDTTCLHMGQECLSMAPADGALLTMCSSVRFKRLQPF